MARNPYTQNDTPVGNVIWNFDEEQLKLIFEIKKYFVIAFNNWDLETAYWKLRLFLKESEPMFDKGEDGKGEQYDLRDKFEEDVTNKRKKYIELKNPNDKNKAEFYLALEEFYVYLCNMIKEKGVYYRQRREDDGL